MTLFTAVMIAPEIAPSSPRPSIIVKIPAMMIIRPAYSTNPAPASRFVPRVREITVRVHMVNLLIRTALPTDATNDPSTVREKSPTPGGPRGPTSGPWSHRLHPPWAVPSQWAIASLREELCSFAKMRLMWFLTVFSVMKQVAAI